jgi:tetratricopeptide (TPR) repeat protein
VSKLALALLALVLAAAPSLAAFDDLGAGARAPGMGNAFTALSDDAYAIYYNPAGLTQLERPQFSASYAQLYTGLNDGSSLGTSQIVYAHPLKYGREGALGLGWQRFSLSSLYSEQTLHLSYGRGVWEGDDGSRLLAGASLKYLQHSFSSTPEASNSCSGGNCVANGADPVLSGSRSKGTPDADLGLIYRFPRYFQAGLMVEHLLRPNVAFSGEDKLPTNVHLGGAYKSLWMSLVGELQLNQAPDGSMDKDFTVAAERFFPTLDYGQFGLRGSLGFGSRDWKQVTVGGSYRINKIQFDYGFLMPIGVFSTGGTHRLAVTLHFGAPNAEDEITREVLERQRLARAPAAAAAPAPAPAAKPQPYAYERQDFARPHDLDDPKLAEVKELVLRGQFRLAHERLVAIMGEGAQDRGLEKLASRLELVAEYFAEMPQGLERADAVVLKSGVSFAEGKDRTAMLFASYAANLRSNEPKYDQYLTALEKATGFKATRVPPDSQRGFIEEMLHEVEAAHNRGENERTVQILRDILELEPGHTTALERLGSAYYLMNRYQDALQAWERALASESKPEEVQSLKQYILQAQEQARKNQMPGGLSKPAEQAPEAAPEQAAPAVRARGEGDPRDVQKLYQRGVEFYARGEYLQATAMFMRILQIDPGNDQARKALERIQRAQSR